MAELSGGSSSAGNFQLKSNAFPSIGIVHSRRLGGGMFANQERQAVSRRIFEALCERFPDRPVMLVVLVVAPLAFAALLIASLIPQTHAFAP
jgi:hypothetical protein